MTYVLFQNAFGDRIKCKNMYISKQTNFKQKIRSTLCSLSLFLLRRKYSIPIDEGRQKDKLKNARQ